jgi:hypothetical protein
MPSVELKDWIRENEVCFEIGPNYELYHQDKLQVGFELTLFAKRPSGCRRGDPGCPACTETYETLRGIALKVLPPNLRSEVGPFNAAFHLRSETHWKTEVDLVVQISHPAGTFDAVDEEDRRQSRLLAEALDGLGVRSRVWSLQRA